MASSKPLRTEQGNNQIAEQQHRGDAGDDVVHGCLSEAITRLDEVPAEDERDGANGEIGQIQHVQSPAMNARK
jgi:hypothetical protein